jgi:GT2 family glycosyltransferase
VGPRASVVILNLNGRRYLDACLEALFSQELEGGYEVIVVDNGSDDGSVEHLRTRWPQVRVVEAGANLGFAGGNNLGIRCARGRHVVLLNNDTCVRAGWLDALASAAETGERVGAVTSKLMFMSRPGVLQSTGSLLLSDGSAGDRGSEEEDRGQYDRREEVFGACGCAMLLTRQALDDVGPFDSSFFLYYEDTDLSWRMRLRGWRMVYEPAAVVDHVHAGTSVEWSPFFTFHVDRNRLFTILKNAPPTFVVRSFWGFALVALRGVARAILRRRRYAPAEPGRVGAPGRALIHSRVLVSLIRHLPEMLGKRFSIRRRRLVPDAEITRWFYSRELWDVRSR